MFKPSYAFDATKCIAAVMGVQGTRGLWNRDAEPEAALLWDFFKCHWRANPKMFEIGEREDDVLPVRVHGMLDFGIDPLLHFNLKPGSPYIKNVAIKWNSKTIILCSDTFKSDASKASAALAAAVAPPVKKPVDAPAPAPMPAPVPYLLKMLDFPELQPLPAPAPPAPVAAPPPPPPPPAPVAGPLPPPRKAQYAPQLTMERVREIRKFKVDNPTWSASAIAKQFNIPYNVAYKMLSGNTYKEAT